MASESVVGTWRLVSIWAESANGHVSYPWGQKPVGYITYTEHGRVSVAIMRGERTRTSTDRTGNLTLEEKAAAYDSFQGYAGTYEVQGDNVFHRIEASLSPNWPGTDLVRHFELQGDRLSLQFSRAISGVMQTQKLVWERA